MCPRNPMSTTTAGELLRIMKVRLACQDEGITDPPSAVEEVTQALVQKLSQLESSEAIEIEVLSSRPLVARYVRSATGEALAELSGAQDT
jgi:hypothetical protein